MLLSEFKSKELLAQFGVRIPEGRVANSPEQAEARCREISAEKYVVKAQIRAGGRGLAGGIRFAATPSAVSDEARRLLGTNLVTEQTGPAGEIVELVYVEAALPIKASYFVAYALDPDSGSPMLIASAEGGVEFEQRVRMDSSIVMDCVLDGTDSANRENVKQFLQKMDVSEDAAVEALMAGLRAFVENDMLLLEINPFVKTATGSWVAVDAKVALDANAMFRHPELESLVGDRSLTTAEREAQRSNINLVKLDGSIGVVVNGAGLGLATNDMIIDAKGRPANFMDIRTTATSFDVARGVELLLDDPGVKVILLNVHGGGMTVCDMVAEGVAFAYSRSKKKLPVVARLAGQNADWGLRILKDRKVPVEVLNTMTAAVARAVELASGGQA